MQAFKPVRLLVQKFFGLVHEGFEAGQGVGLFLAVIGHVEDGDVVILLPVSLEKGAHNGSGHAGEGHDVDDAADSAFRKVDRLSDREDRFSFERRIDVRFGLLEKDLVFGSPKCLRESLNNFSSRCSSFF